MQFYNYCTIKRDDRIFEVIKKINDIKNNYNFFPCGIYLEKKKVKGIFTLGDIRRLAIKKINSNEKAFKYLNFKPVIVKEKFLDNDLNNRLNEFNKKKKLDFILVELGNNKSIKILKVSDIVNNQEYRKTCVIGLGHIGLPLLVHLANNIKKLCGYDISKKVIDKLTQGKFNFFEKNLNNLLIQNIKQKKLHFSNYLSGINAQNYIICLGSEINKKKIDNSSLINLFKKVAARINKNDLIILRGTVQIGMARKLLIPILERKSGLKCGEDFFFSYMPERLIEGDALNEFKTIPQLISGYTNFCKNIALDFAKINFENIIELDSIEEGEIIKLASNTYRDLNFAFANEITRISSKYELSGNKLIEKANLGYERNEISKPSIGVGGYCLPKDTLLFSKLYNKKDGYSLGITSRRINEKNISECFKKIIKKTGYSIKKVLILGATFKGRPETIDVRNSSSIKLYQLFKRKKIKCFFYDVLQKKIKITINNVKIPFVTGSLKLNTYDLIILANNHPKYVEIVENTPAIKENKTKSNKTIFDPWCLLNKDLITKMNWKYISL